MSSTLITRPVYRLLTLLLVCIVAGGCRTSPGSMSSPGAAGSKAASAPEATAPETKTAFGLPEAALATAEPRATAGTTATPQPPASPKARDMARSSAELVTLEALANTTLQARDPVELAYQFGRATSRQRVVSTTPLEVKVGDKQEFNIVNLAVAADDPARNRTITATLVVVLDHVLAYVEDGLDIDLAALEHSSRRFNDQIYPRNRELFGSEWTPGIDGDPRITILNASFAGASGYSTAGYFDINDEAPKSANRLSNEREMLYINVDALAPGSTGYATTLVHEFQHMIEWNEAKRSATWLNEGLSQLAEEINGFQEDLPGGTSAYLADPDLQLTDWGTTFGESSAHYGASYLFLSYFYEHYAQPADLRRLVKEGAGERLQLFADIAQQQNGAIQDFGDLYADWSIANLLNNRELEAGQYAYTHLPAVVEPQVLGQVVSDTVAQFGSDYWGVPPSRQERVFAFDGSDTIGVVAARPAGRAIWWSNRGDNAHMALERHFDLRGVQSATLQFRLWYDFEDGWDYGFVAVSTDGGERWTTLPGRYTTTEDPQGANYGNGYTGMSGITQAGGGIEREEAGPSWLDEQIDLTPYAGQEILLRFSAINDQGTNRPGMALDNIRIPEINFSDSAETGDAGWQADGFVRTDNALPQQWEVRIVRTVGTMLAVEALTLDGKHRGEFRVAPNESAVVIIMPTTPHTTERASYRLRLIQP